MAKKRERIVHEYELERPLMAPDPVQKWWEPDEDPHEPDSARVPPSRAQRHAKPKPRRPTWTIVAMLLGLIAIVLAGLLIYMDFEHNWNEGAPTTRTSSAAERPSGRIYADLPSPDTIKERLEKAGYKVRFLVDTYDRTKHGYDVADTEINDHEAQILAMPDEATTRDFVNVAGNTGYTVVWGKLWAISLGHNQDLETKQLAEEIADRLHAQFAWTPEEE